jgi:hypothetical protein
MTNEDVKIAILETKLGQVAYDIERLEKRIVGLVDKIDELTTVMNKGKGAYAFALIVAGSIGACISAILAKFGLATQ